MQLHLYSPHLLHHQPHHVLPAAAAAAAVAAAATSLQVIKYEPCGIWAVLHAREEEVVDG
jgi:hypothetical protein